MNIPKLPADTSTFVWGAVTGAIALSIYGFAWGGWVTGGKSEILASAAADKAVLSSLVPICVAQFRASAKAPASLAALKATEVWQQTEYVQKGGWATMPGTGAGVEPSRDVAEACAQALSKLVL